MKHQSILWLFTISLLAGCASEGNGETPANQSGSGGKGGSSGAASSGGAAGAGGNAGSSSSVGGDAGTGGTSGGSAGTGGGSGGSGGTAGGTSGPLTLTSTALAEGAEFAAENVSCGPGSNNKSPPFTWSGGPSNVMGYAIVMTDKTISFRHWVLWDVPPATMSLSAALPGDATLATPAGAQQKAFYGNGYVGPCPGNGGGGEHTYEFALYALDVATLPDVSQANSLDELATAVEAHDLASATLTGRSSATN